jgi:hypothetical protein
VVSDVSYSSGAQPGNGQVVISWTPGGPSVAVSSPTENGVYGVGSTLVSAFSCADGAAGPGIASCADHAGHASGTALSTATAGTFTETITAASGDGLSTQQSVTYTVVGAPVASAQRTVSGTAKARSQLQCAAPSFSGDPTATSYRWERDGTPIAGAHGETYTIATGDEGTTLSCVVSATGPGGTGPAIANAGVSVPVPHVAGCPAAKGSVRGTRIGPLELGQTLRRSSTPQQPAI